MALVRTANRYFAAVGEVWTAVINREAARLRARRLRTGRPVTTTFAGYEDGAAILLGAIDLLAVVRLERELARPPA